MFKDMIIWVNSLYLYTLNDYVICTCLSLSLYTTYMQTYLVWSTGTDGPLTTSSGIFDHWCGLGSCMATGHPLTRMLHKRYKECIWSESESGEVTIQCKTDTLRSVQNLCSKTVILSQHVDTALMNAHTPSFASKCFWPCIPLLRTMAPRSVDDWSQSATRQDGHCWGQKDVLVGTLHFIGTIKKK